MQQIPSTPIQDGHLDQDIMDGMLRETFQDERSEETESQEALFQIDPSLDRALWPMAEKFSSYLRLILMQVLPRQLGIEFQQNYQLSYQELSEFIPERSYFSMIWMRPDASVWFMHLDRQLAEGMAGRKYNLEFGPSGKRWHEVAEADSSIYLEIGELLRRCFNGIPKAWGARGKLEVDCFRHMLQPAFLEEVQPDDLYVVQKFEVQHPELNGTLHLGVPYFMILRLLGTELAA
jgi:flagellar motor switch protein FliM